MRRGAVAVASLILMLGLAVGFYLGRRHSNAQLATPTTSSSLQSKLTPQAPSPPAGPHDRPDPILMYHVVGPTPPRAALPGLYVSRADFASQLPWLARTGYHAVTLDAVDRYWRGGARAPSRP